MRQLHSTGWHVQNVAQRTAFCTVLIIAAAPSAAASPASEPLPAAASVVDDTWTMAQHRAAALVAQMILSDGTNGAGNGNTGTIGSSSRDIRAAATTTVTATRG